MLACKKQATAYGVHRDAAALQWRTVQLYLDGGGRMVAVAGPLSGLAVAALSRQAGALTLLLATLSASCFISCSVLSLTAAIITPAFALQGNKPRDLDKALSLASLFLRWSFGLFVTGAAAELILLGVVGGSSFLGNFFVVLTVAIGGGIIANDAQNLILPLLSRIWAPASPTLFCDPVAPGCRVVLHGKNPSNHCEKQSKLHECDVEIELIETKL